MPVTPTGPLHQFLNDLRTFLSGLDNVQAFLGVPGDQPAALALIYLYEDPSPGAETEYLVMHGMGRFEWDRDEMATGLAGGIASQPVRVGFWQHYTDESDITQDNVVTFVNSLGAIIQEAVNESGDSGNVWITNVKVNADLEPGELPTFRMAEEYGIGYLAYLDFDQDMRR